METKEQGDKKLELTSPEQAHLAVLGAAKDALNNKTASASGFLQIARQQQLSEEAQKLSLKEDLEEPEAETIEDQIVATARQIISQIEKKTESENPDEFIVELTGKIATAEIPDNIKPIIVESMGKVRVILENIQTLAGNRPERKLPPLIDTSVGIYFDLSFVPERKSL